MHLSTYLFHYLYEYFAFSLSKLFSSLRGALLKILKEMQEGKLIWIILKENNIVKKKNLE